MTSFTPVYALPYPNALDEPCDFPEDWCAFTDAVDGVLDRFELGAQRVVPAIPVAQVRITSSVVVAENTAFSWDTVSVDTAGWTNFDADNQVITISRTGRYSAVGSAIFAPTGVTNSGILLMISSTIATSTDYLDRNVANTDIGIVTAAEANTINAGTQVGMSFVRTNAGGALNLNAASLTVFWHADTERP